MAKLQVERLGGLAGFGGAHARIRSLGEIDLATLSAADRKAVDGLFESKEKTPPSQARDSFRYRICRTTSEGVETIELPEEDVPAVVSQCVKDEFV